MPGITAPDAASDVTAPDVTVAIIGTGSAASAWPRGCAGPALRTW
jgi:hypothetical protein